MDLRRIIEGKRAQRQRITARPVAEKLRMLDAMRERALAIRSAAPVVPESSAPVREEPASYEQSGGKKEN